MMPDLGKYAGEVLAAYGIGIFLLLALTVMSLRQARRARRLLDELETRRQRDG
ncbi:MAG: heme exporter protein CcmD [Rhodobacteraceae bacterium]|nr:heme exporter protein CcmD [Paracoccaceae bacterium]